MKEYGQVKDLRGNGALIVIKRSSACDRCGACQLGCHQDEMQLLIPNTLAAKPGDYVELELQDSQVLKASAITYLIPLAALIGGVAAGYTLAPLLNLDSEITGAVTGLIFTVLAFLGIRIFEPSLRKHGRYSPRMISIVEQPYNESQ